MINRKELEMLERITLNPNPKVGQPVIRNTDLTVQKVLNLLSRDIPLVEIVKQHPPVTEEDLRACLLFAQKTMEDITFMPLD